MNGAARTSFTGYSGFAPAIFSLFSTPCEWLVRGFVPRPGLLTHPDSTQTPASSDLTRGLEEHPKGSLDADGVTLPRKAIPHYPISAPRNLILRND